jgi:hypothetical protein
MNIRNTVRAVAVRIAILTGILIAITLFINLSWFDEELNKDLVALNTPRDVPMEGNAYPLFYGFLAAADRDPAEAGLKIIRTMQERSRAGEPAMLTNDEVDEILGHPGPEVWKGALRSTNCNSSVVAGLDCLDRVVTEATDANLDNPRLRLLIERFEQLLQVPRWKEFRELDYNSVSMPQPYGDLTTISRIRLGESIRTNTTARFLLDISQDIRFWKRMLDGGQNLMSKMIALGGLHFDAKILSTLMRTRKLSAEELRGMSDVLSPLTESERNIEEAFLGELWFSSMSGRMSIVDDWMSLSRLALQRNATANELYMTRTLPVRLRASLSAAEFYRQRAYEPLNDRMRFMPPPLYNLGGKLLLRGFVGYGTSSLNYISRVHDLDGRISLVLLQAEVALKADIGVQDVVKGSRYRNPYTGEPMDYDPSNGTISFPCLARPRDVCAVKLK